MKRSLILAGAMLFAAQTAATALTPVPEPHNHKIRSANGRFFAYCRASPARVEIKQARKFWFPKTLWSIDQYIEWAQLADDGSYLVTGDDLVAPPFSKSVEVIRVFLSDGRTRTFTLGQFVDDMRKLRPAMGLGSYGGYSRLIGDWLKVETCEGRTLFANVKTGEVRLQQPD
jgi:ABC-type amino acid transport substrate-binding protein